MAEVVPISRVVPLRDNVSPYFVRKMMDTLSRQGQIEPLQVHPFENHFIVWNDDVWGNEIIAAARKLGWDTILITVTTKFLE